MPRTIPTTSWNRDRFTFGLIDVDGDVLMDVDGAILLGITDENPLVTQWS